jgi:uncharacterized protein involved in exopolysaccharide biosynthesis/Mrp family chromosome partitioning ATPase
MSGQANTNQVIDVTKIIRYFLRHWYIFAGSVVLALAVTFVYHRYQTPVYSLSVSMLIEDKTANLLLPDGTTSIINSKAIDNEIAVLKSYSEIRQIIDQLDFDVSYYSKGELSLKEIYKSSPFVVKFDPARNKNYGVPVTLKFLSDKEFSLSSEGGEFGSGKIYNTGDTIQAGGFSFTVTWRENGDNSRYTGKAYSFVMRTKDELVKTYRAKTSIRLERGTSILTVSSYGTSVDMEKDFLNKLAEVYITGNLERKNQMSNNSLDFINEQLAQTSDSLAGVENRLENFRKDNNLMKLVDKSVPILQRENNLQKSKADELLNLKYYKYLRDYLINNDNVDDIVAPSTVGISLPMFSDLLLKLSTTYLEKEDLMANSTKDNPFIQSLETEIINQKRVLLENITNVIHTAEMKINDYDTQIGENIDDFEKLPHLEREYVEIERLNKLNGEMYMYLMQKRAEAGIARANNVADLVLIDKAGDNGVVRIKPDVKSNNMRSLLLAVVLPSLLLFFLFMMSRKISEPEELQDMSGFPLAGVLGHYAAKSPGELQKNPHSDIVQVLKKIRVKIPANEEGKAKVIGTTSTIFCDGKTFVAANLALSFAMTGKRTLLADFNFYRQELAGLFGINEQAGTGKEDTVISTRHPRLSLFIPDSRGESTDQLIHSGKLGQWIDSFLKDYDVIIIDLPPVGLTSDVYDASSRIDTLLFIAREDHSPRKLLFQTLEQLASSDLAGKTLTIYNDSGNSRKSSSYEYYLEKQNKKGLARFIFQVKHRLV